MSQPSYPRSQLTLFLDAADTEVIEAVRRAYNPAQFRLIAAHVTLCRDEECRDEDRLKAHAERLSVNAFSLRTGALYRFAGGKGLALELRDAGQDFRKLRGAVIGESLLDRPEQQPHITLIHPRNGTCTDRLYDSIRGLPFPDFVHIRSLSFIRQREPQLPWVAEWSVRLDA